MLQYGACSMRWLMEEDFERERWIKLNILKFSHSDVFLLDQSFSCLFCYVTFPISFGII